jgi:hypothetical protein
VKTSTITLRVDSTLEAALNDISAKVGTDRTVVLRALISAAAEALKKSGSISMPFVIQGGSAGATSFTSESHWNSLVEAGEDIVPQIISAFTAEADQARELAQKYKQYSVHPENATEMNEAAMGKENQAEDLIDQAYSVRPVWRKLLRLIRLAAKFRANRRARLVNAAARGYVSDPFRPIESETESRAAMFDAKAEKETDREVAQYLREEAVRIRGLFKDGPRETEGKVLDPAVVAAASDRRAGYDDGAPD